MDLEFSLADLVLVIWVQDSSLLVMTDRWSVYEFMMCSLLAS